MVNLVCEMAQASIVIRTYNEQQILPRTLAALRTQTFQNYRLIVVDSGSTDHTVAIAKEFHGVRLVEVAHSEFTFGRGLNLGIAASESDTEFVAILSAHAIPVSHDWLENLLEPMLSSAEVVGVFGKQIPLEEHLSNPVVRALEKYGYPEYFGDDAYGTKENHRFSNTNSAIRMSAWRALPFDEQAEFAEDQIWAHEMLSQGHSIAYEPGAIVYHSHPDSYRRYYQRTYAGESAMVVQGLATDQRDFKAWLKNQFAYLWEYAYSIYDLNSLMGIHWDLLRLKTVANWAWYRAGKARSDADR